MLGYVYVKYPDAYKEGKKFSCSIPVDEELLSSRDVSLRIVKLYAFINISND